MDGKFSIKDKQFSLKKINALRQFHIVRRMVPVLSELLPVMQKLGKVKESENNDEMVDKFLSEFGTVLLGFSKMTEKDSEAVFLELLASVQVQQDPGNWANLANGASLMFEDLGLPTLLNCAGRAFMFNLSGFFDVLPQVSRGK